MLNDMSTTHKILNSGLTYFAVAFLVIFTLATLLLMHVKHTLFFDSFYGPASVSATERSGSAGEQYPTDVLAQVATAKLVDDGGCGCPTCCSIQ